MKEGRVYKTVSGDTWDRISFKVYGSEFFICELIDANPDLRHVAKFRAGKVVVVPEVEVKKEGAGPPWKRTQ